MSLEYDKMQALLQDLTTNARIAEYGCSCAVLAEDWERAKMEAKRANIFRQAFMKTAEQYLQENCKDEN